MGCSGMAGGIVRDESSHRLRSHGDAGEFEQAGTMIWREFCSPFNKSAAALRSTVPAQRAEREEEQARWQ